MTTKAKANGKAEAEATTEEEPVRSVAEDLAAVLDASEAPGEEDDVPAVEETAEDAEAPDDEAEEPAEGEEPAEEAAAEETETEETEETEESEEDKPTVEAPEHWPTEDKQFFSELPDDDTRQRVLSLQRSIERRADEKFQQAADARKTAEEIDRLTKPFEQELRLAGMTPMDGIRRLVAAEDLLRKDPSAGLEWLAGQYGGSVAGTDHARDMVRRMASVLKVEVGGETNADNSDPTQAEIRALKSEVAQLRQGHQTAEQTRVQQTQREAQATLDAFSSAKDDAGNPKHPHFEAVKPDMGAMMQAAAARGEELTLENAYDRAVWARPDLRENLLKAQRKAEAEKLEVDRKAHLQKAKAAKSPKPRSVPAQEAEEDLPLRDALSKAWDDSSGARP